MLKVAVTGNIASGKTLLLDYLQNEGYTVFCLDIATHKIYESSKKFNNFLLKNFNTTKRAEIAKIVFEDKNKMKLLEKNICPLILDALNDFFLENGSEKVTFTAAPLLFEYGFDKFFDKKIIVTAPEKIRLERLIARNNFTLEEAKKRINSQMPESEKLQKCDFVIKNEGTISDFYINCSTVIKEIMSLV